ncbi:MAG: hypothetical protein EON99_00075 [Chitinophagaceae bacterium]|nr:MAG: hypothetical protein EON99_00075 [Chitinophagaceae bacterium]
MSQKIRAAITAVGGFVPEKRLTNKDLEKLVLLSCLDRFCMRTISSYNLETHVFVIRRQLGWRLCTQRLSSSRQRPTENG